MVKRRKKYTPEEKVSILKRHLVEIVQGGCAIFVLPAPPCPAGPQPPQELPAGKTEHIVEDKPLLTTI